MNRYERSLRILRKQVLESSAGIIRTNELPPLPPYLEQSIELFKENRSWWTYEPFEHQVKAFFGLARAWEPFFGMNIQRCLFRFDWTDPTSVEWMVETLEKHLPEAHSESYMQLFPAQRILWPILKRKGYGISDVAFGGFPALSLERLSAHYRDRPSVSLSDLRLRVDPLVDEGDLPAINQLRDKVFTDEPERYWQYHNSGVAAGYAKLARERLTNGRQWKISKDGEILGMFGFGPSVRTVFGKEVGLDFAVHKSLHGLGLGRLAYETMLPRIRDEGVEYFTGSTANPSVIHLARIMGRPLELFDIRARSSCPDQTMFAVEQNLLES